MDVCQIVRLLSVYCAFIVRLLCVVDSVLKGNKGEKLTPRKELNGAKML